MEKTLKHWLENWKPIHLCWWFEKHNLPIPKYFIGGANAAPQYEGSRISTATRTWPEVEDADVTDWTVGDDFCVSVAFGAPSGNQSSSRTLQLRWRNQSDGGSFAALSATGELTWSGTTDLVNDNGLTEVESGLAASQATFVAGLEREGANDWAYTSLLDGEWSAIMWAIDTSNALAGKQYEFELYNVTDTAIVATCSAQITMAAGGGTAYDDFIVGEFGSSGTVARKVSYTREQAGAIESSGIISRALSLKRALAGDLESSGIIARAASLKRLLQGVLDTSGIVGRTISLKRFLQGTIEATGTVAQQFAHDFVLSLSDNFTDGAATTFQLTAPATKATTDFVAGKIHESSNPADSIDITADDYTEIEFCFQGTEYAKEVSYDFRIEGVDDYTVTPQLTIGAGATEYIRAAAGALPAMAGALLRVLKAKRSTGGEI